MDTSPPALSPDFLDTLVRARHVVAVTGAGVSAPSGIQTYRDRGAGWRDSEREEMSRASRYGHHLGELWEFWGALHQSVTSAAPNPAHLALSAWEEHLRARGGSLLVATQNVDGLHQRAGSREVTELHGSILRSRCTHCRTRAATTLPAREGAAPACTHCGRSLRPDVVMFEEPLSKQVLSAVRQRLAHAELCLYVGTSGNVHPVAGFVTTARSGGARCVLVNAEAWDDPSDEFHDTLVGGAESVLPRLAEAAQQSTRT